MITDLSKLDDAISAVCKHDGFNQHKIQFSKDATAEQQAAAQAILAAWNWDDDSKNIFSTTAAKQAISSLRYNHETGGITIGGQPISSARDEIGHWYPRFANAQEWLANDSSAVAFNPSGVYPYKPKGGDPSSLSAAQVVRAYMCLSWFVNACFATEEYFYSLVNASDGTKPALDDIIASVSWPQNIFEWEPK